MKPYLKILIAFMILLVIVGLAVFFISFHNAETVNPTTTLPTQQPFVIGPATQSVPVVQSEIAASITSSLKIQVQEDTPNLTLSRLAVRDGYALADWIDENIGGMVVFKYDDSMQHWVIIDMDGGVLGLEDIITAGVPESTARQLYSDYSKTV